MTRGRNRTEKKGFLSCKRVGVGQSRRRTAERGWRRVSKSGKQLGEERFYKGPKRK